MSNSRRGYGLGSTTLPRVMSPGGRTHAGIDARGCSSRWNESGCATMLESWRTLSMSRNGTGTGIGSGIGNSIGMGSSMTIG